jgi:DNA-binding NarL/FixJ family response regulator
MLQLRATAAVVDGDQCLLPCCSSHPGSLVRRYRCVGPNGSGVYPQCVPTDGARPHLLAWSEAPRASAVPSEVHNLSASELAVLEDAANGLTVNETATKRSKSPETVKSQRRSVLLKLGARNIAQAVAMMISDGLIATAETRVHAVGRR